MSDAKLFVATLALLALVLAGGGCAEKVIDAELPTREEETTVPCNKGPGYCMGCGINFKGSFDCGFGFRPRCPGRQRVRARATPYVWHWSDEPEVKHQDRRWGETTAVLGECK